MDQTNASKHKPMHLRGDISVTDMEIDKVTILKFCIACFRGEVKVMWYGEYVLCVYHVKWIVSIELLQYESCIIKMFTGN